MDLSNEKIEAAVNRLPVVECMNCHTEMSEMFTKSTANGNHICFECIDSYFIKTCDTCDTVLEDNINGIKTICPNCGEGLYSEY